MRAFKGLRWRPGPVQSPPRGVSGEPVNHNACSAGQTMTKQILRWVLLIVLVAGAVWYASTHGELFQGIAEIPVWRVSLLVCLVLVRRLLMGLQFRTACACFDLKLGAKKWFSLPAACIVYNYFLPGHAGIGMQGVYLKKRYGLSYAHFASLIAASNLLRLTVAAFVILAASVPALCFGGHVPAALVGVAGAVFALCLFGVIAPGRSSSTDKPLPTGSVGRFFAKIAEGLTLFHRRRKLIYEYVGLCFAERLVGAGILLVSCAALSVDIAAHQALIVQSAGAFSTLLILTPGNIGVLEGLMSAVGGLLGLSVKGIVSAALLHRAAAVVVTFLLGVPASHYLLAPSHLSAGGLRRELQEEEVA